MKIAIIGANGKAGSRILAEAKSRGHEVTAIVRNKSKVEDKSINVIEKDMFDLTTADLKPFDAVVNAFGDFVSEDNLFLKSGKYLVSLLKGPDNPLLFVVGGAGSLYAGGKQIFTLPDFPPAYYPTASKMAAELDYLQTVYDVNWIFLSPSAEFAPGKRTGKFRLGDDELLVDKNGKSWISMEDYAIAVINELEKPKHIKRRFTVGY